MKKIFIALATLVLVSFVAAPAGLSKKERKTAATFLKDSEKNAVKLVGKLSEAQLKFKPPTDKWSDAK